MKIRKLIWIGVFILPVFACNKTDDVLQTEATIELIVPLTSNEIDINLKSVYMFSGRANFCLGKKDNVKNCPVNVLGVKQGTGAILNITLPDKTANVSNLVLRWGYSSTEPNQFKMQETIELNINESSLAEGSLSLNLDKVLTPLISNMDVSPNNYFTIEVSGNTESKLTSIATIKVPIIIEHENLSIRFGVF